MSKRAAVPALRTGQREIDRFASAVKANMDQMTGQGQGSVPLQPLDPATATTADIARQLNAILERLQGS